MIFEMTKGGPQRLRDLSPWPDVHHLADAPWEHCWFIVHQRYVYKFILVNTTHGEVYRALLPPPPVIFGTRSFRPFPNATAKYFTEPIEEILADFPSWLMAQLL